MPIIYGGHEFYLSRIYRLAGTMDNPKLRRKRVWVHELVNRHGCDWLRVTMADTTIDSAAGTEWFVKPFYVIPE